MDRKSVTSVLLALSVAPLILTTQASFAQWSSDPNINLAVCDTSGSQELPKIAATSDGGCYVSWFDTRGGGYKVYMQRLNAQGVKQWSTNGLLISGNPQNTSLVDYDLTVDDSNYAIVVFTDVRNAGQIEPFAYRISPQGNFVWGANGIAISTSPATYQPNPKVVSTSDGSYVFAWIFGSTPNKVALQRLNAVGAKQWGVDPILLVGTGSENLTYPSLVRSDAGNVILLMSGYTGTFLNPQNYRLYTQKYSPAGTPMWGSVPDTVYALGRVSGFFVPKLIPDGNNGALYVWHDDRNNTGSSFSHVQYITSADVKLFPVNGAAGSTLPGRLHNDAWVTNTPATGETYMFWYETDAQFQSSYGVYGQKFSSNGTRQWPDSGKAFRSFGGGQPSFIRCVAKDSSAVVFYFDGVTVTSNLVKGFKIDRNGNFLWSGSIINASSILSSKGRLGGAFTATSTSLLTWSDNRVDGNGVYGQNVNFDGTLGISGGGPLSGAYTVGTGGDFPKLDSAFARLRSQGVTGPVTLNLVDTVYDAPGSPVERDLSAAMSRRPELDPLDPQSIQKKDGGEERAQKDRPLETAVNDGATMNPDTVGALTLTGPIPGASAVNRITIRPATNKSITITGDGASVIQLVNASYVTVDGVSLTGPTRLAIRNTASNANGLMIRGNSDNNIVQNVTVRTRFASGTGICLLADSGGTPDNNLINNNAVETAWMGIFVLGDLSWGIPNSNRIVGNFVGSPIDSIGMIGIYSGETSNTIIDHNYIQNIRQGAPAFDLGGIWIANKHSNTKVSNNVVRNAKIWSNASGSNLMVSGFYIFGTSTDSTRGVYYNNMIYDLDNRSSNNTSVVQGIYVGAGQCDTVAYNSIYLTGTAPSEKISAALTAETHVGLVVRNNILVNSRIEVGAGRAMAFYKTLQTSTITSNYNNLFVPVQPRSYIGAEGATNYATIAEWRSLTYDSLSQNVMATFRAPDLHIDSTVVTPINGGAMPLPGIAIDYDGQTRNAITPDIGADEFTVATPPQGWTVQTSGVTTSLTSVKAVSQNAAWTAGTGGKVLRTINGGATWVPVGGGNLGTSNLYAIDALDTALAFVTMTVPSTGGTTYIYRTTNGGTNWTQVYSLADSSAKIQAIHMYDAATGIALGNPVGGKWVILRTTDGGSTWNRMATEPNQSTTAIGVRNGLATWGTTHIWFIALVPSTTSYSIYRSTTSGMTWIGNWTTGGEVPSSLSFNDAQNGFNCFFQVAAGRTTDGGSTWLSAPVPGSGLFSAVSGTGSNFFVARTSGVWRSTDLGVSWTASFAGTIGQINHMNFVKVGANVRGWCVSETGGIATAWFTVTEVNEENDKPLTFALQQNYPNPFNPTTTLRYALPMDARVTLSIYNILGQRIATLKDEIQNAGYYDAVWNGTNDFGSRVSSGVYFYRIETRPTGGRDVFTSIKKMMFLK
jgi:photosystem II stability/assembly factor-like uncharacterized protein